MTVAQSVASNLPALRRFARALSGSQESGDAYVVAVLEALAKDVTIFPRDMEPKVALFHLLLKIWDSVDLNAEPSAPPDASRPMRRLQRLTPKPRQALLLLAVEGFDPEAIAQILDTDVDDVASLIERADEEVAR